MRLSVSHSTDRAKFPWLFVYVLLFFRRSSLCFESEKVCNCRKDEMQTLWVSLAPSYRTSVANWWQPLLIRHVFQHVYKYMKKYVYVFDFYQIGIVGRVLCRQLGHWPSNLNTQLQNVRSLKDRLRYFFHNDRRFFSDSSKARRLFVYKSCQFSIWTFSVSKLFVSRESIRS